MRLKTLERIGFVQVSSLEFKESLQYIRNYYDVISRSQYDEVTDETFLSYEMSQKDFEEMFGAVPNFNRQRVLGFSIRGKFYVWHMIYGLKGFYHDAA